MSPQTVVVVTWVSAAVVVGLYVWFVVWRVRVDRRKKAAETETATRMSSAIARAAQVSSELEQERRGPTVPAPAAPATTTAPVPGTPAPVATAASTATVAGLLSGI